MNPVATPSRAGRAASRGFTLIELLVSVTIGLLLTVVIAQLFLGSRQSFVTTDDVSRLQENIRFSQQLLLRTVHLAGYKSKPNSVTTTIFNAANPAITALNNAGLGGTDIIILRYQGSGDGAGNADGTVLDCRGNRVDAGVISSNQFEIRTGANGAPALGCSTDLGLNWVEIVPNVENMQIVYGVDTDTNLVANEYVPADQVAAANWNGVISVRIALLYHTPTQGSQAITDNRNYTLISAANGAVVGPFNDRRIRRVVTTTMNLRNRTP